VNEGIIKFRVMKSPCRMTTVYVLMEIFHKKFKKSVKPFMRCIKIPIYDVIKTRPYCESVWLKIRAAQQRL
jgi:hypothetical protein